MRGWAIGVTVFLLGCDTTGTAGPASDASATDAPADSTAPQGDDAASSAADAGDAADAPSLPPCTDIDAGTPVQSDDCVYAGPCPQDCAMSTASAYACAAGDGGAATYPSTFSLPADPVDVVALQAAAYPWDAGAYVSCAPLACVRWATADHVEGGSAWPSDPCAIGDAAVLAWACPASPGVMPPLAGCFNAGDGQQIGGVGTPVPANAVWCCPPAPTADGGPGDDGGAADAAGPDAAADAGADAASE